MIRVTTIDSDGEIVLVDDQLLVVFLRDDAAMVVGEGAFDQFRGSSSWSRSRKRRKRIALRRIKRDDPC